MVANQSRKELERARFVGLPTSVQTYLHELVLQIERSFGEDLRGVYLHGSAAFGHFVSGSSDLDLLLVVEQKDPTMDKELFRCLLDMALPDEVLGLEVSVLTRESLKTNGLKRPFRSHFWISAGEQRFVPGAGHPGDSDLILHFAVCNSTGVALFGPSPKDMFPVPSNREILEVLVTELEWAKQNGDWVYAVLNAARALRFAEELVVSSKLSGWLWLRARTPGAHFLDSALVVYLTPRVDHHAPPPKLQGFDEWAQLLLVSVLARLHSSLDASKDSRD